MNPGFMHRTCRAACRMCRPGSGNAVRRPPPCHAARGLAVLLKITLDLLLLESPVLSRQTAYGLPGGCGDGGTTQQSMMPVHCAKGLCAHGQTATGAGGGSAAQRDPRPQQLPQAVPQPGSGARPQAERDEQREAGRDAQQEPPQETPDRPEPAAAQARRAGPVERADEPLPQPQEATGGAAARQEARPQRADLGPPREPAAAAQQGLDAQQGLEARQIAQAGALERESGAAGRAQLDQALLGSQPGQAAAQATRRGSPAERTPEAEAAGEGGDAPAPPRERGADAEPGGAGVARARALAEPRAGGGAGAVSVAGAAAAEGAAGGAAGGGAREAAAGALQQLAAAGGRSEEPVRDGTAVSPYERAAGAAEGGSGGRGSKAPREGGDRGGAGPGAVPLPPDAARAEAGAAAGGASPALASMSPRPRSPAEVTTPPVVAGAGDALGLVQGNGAQMAKPQSVSGSAERQGLSGDSDPDEARRGAQPQPRPDELRAAEARAVREEWAARVRAAAEARAAAAAARARDGADAASSKPVGERAGERGAQGTAAAVGGGAGAGGGSGDAHGSGVERSGRDAGSGGGGGGVSRSPDGGGVAGLAAGDSDAQGASIGGTPRNPADTGAGLATEAPGGAQGGGGGGGGGGVQTLAPETLVDPDAQRRVQAGSIDAEWARLQAVVAADGEQAGGGGRAPGEEAAGGSPDALGQGRAGTQGQGDQGTRGAEEQRGLDTVRVARARKGRGVAGAAAALMDARARLVERRQRACYANPALTMLQVAGGLGRPACATTRCLPLC